VTAELGILGGGQLGCLLHRAATAEGLTVRIADPDPESPARHLPGYAEASDWSRAVEVLGATCAVVTWEREDLDPEALAALRVPVRPSPPVLATTQDRLGYKRLVERLGIATAQWVDAAGPDATDTVIDRLGLPVMVKARRGGFDGRGQVLARDRAELQGALERFADCGAIAERLVPFDDEFAALVTRGHDGEIVHYPLVRTCQHAGQLAWALAPHPREAQLVAWARGVAEAIVAALDHVGTLAVECFRCGDEALVNEIAPRVHNSGHWTIEGCSVDQFTNHVLAVSGRALREPAARGVSLLRNCIGRMPAAVDTPGATLHDYGKRPRPGRKVGHLTVVARDAEELAARIHHLPGTLRVDESDAFGRPAR